MPKGHVMRPKERRRNVAFVAYPESLEYVRLRDFLESLGIKSAISPLHSEDVWTEYDVHEWMTRSNHVDSHGKLLDEYKNKVPEVGSKKKAHWHVCLFFKGQKYLHGLVKMFEPIGIKTFWVVEDKDEYIRYLCHLDDVGKAQYDVNEVVGFSGIDLSPLWELSKSQKRDYVKLTLAMIKDGRIDNFADLVDECMGLDDGAFFDVVWDKGYQFQMYLSANAQRLNRGSRKVVYLSPDGEIMEARMMKGDKQDV